MGKFDLRIKKAVAEIAEEMRKKVEELWLSSEQNLNSYHAKLAAFMNINTYVRSRGKVSGGRESWLMIAALLVEIISIFTLFQQRN